MTDLATHRQKKSKHVLEKFADGSNSAFLHGVEWDRLIVHEPYKREVKKTKIFVKTVIFQWIQMKISHTDQESK